MAVPSLPAHGSPDWYGYAQGLHNEVTTGRLSDTALRAAFDAVSANRNRVAFLGDSISELYGSGDAASFEVATNNYSYFIPALAAGRIQYGGVFSDPSLTLAQIRTGPLARLLGLPASRLPGTVVVLGGTNDVGSGGFSLTASAADLTVICDALAAAGCRPVLCTVPPSNINATVQQNVARWNAYVTGFARRRGYALFDFHAALVDPATGQYATGLNVDNTHPSPAGMLAMAQAAIASGWLNTLPAWRVGLTESAADTVNLIPSGNGLFVGGLNGNGVPVGSSGFGGTGATVSIVDPTAGTLLGKWAQISMPSTGTGTYYVQYNYDIAGFAAVGDLVSLSLRIAAAGLTGKYGTSAGATAYLTLADASNADLDAISFTTGQDLDGVVYLERVLPAAASKIKVTWALDVPSSGTATMKVGQMTVRNLTALGLA